MTTTNNIPGLGRRVALAKVFEAYPQVCRGFASRAGVGHAGEKTEEREHAANRLLNRPDFTWRATQVLAARFAVRLLVTRAAMEEENGGDAAALETFSRGLQNRLVELAEKSLDGFKLQGAAIPGKALQAFEEEMANVVFDSLAVDAESDTFEESNFWADVFRALGDTDGSGAIVHGLSAVVLDRLDELRHAFRITAGDHVLDLAPANLH
jgi:hypothetical protein